MSAVPLPSNVVQVERLLSALGAGDDATVLGLVDPSIELVPLAVSAGLVPDAYRGLDGIRAYLEDADAVDIERGFVAARVRGVQDTVVAFGDLPAERATVPALWIWRVRNGLATYGMLVSDEGARQAASDAAVEPRRAALELELPALPDSAADARHALQIWAGNLTLTAQERGDILLAVSEAATNAIRHAYPGRAENPGFRLSAVISGDRLQVAVTDDGVGICPSSNAGLGVGLPLLGTLADALMLVGPPERPAGLEVRMWFPLASLAYRASPGGQTTPGSSGS